MSTPPLQEILMQEALKYENGYLEVPNLGLLNHYLNHPQRNSIVDLSLYCYQHIVEAIEMFAKDMNNLSVARLYLRAVNIDDDTFQTLISKDGFSKLKKLGLSYNSELTDQTISNIASEEKPLQLRVLELDTTGVTDEGVKTLAFSSSFSKLKELDLSGLSITTAAIQYLAHPFAIPRLSLLQIQLTEIDQAVFPLFSLSSSFAKLKSLCISHVGIMDPQEIAVLCNRSPYSFSLKKLTLKSCELGIGHMKLICQSENFRYLESLDISENDLTDKAVSLLLRAKFQNTLKNLNLARNTISDKFLKKLGKSKCYQNLETLNLVSCHKIKSLEALTYRKKRPFQGLYLSKLKSSQKEMTAILHNHFWQLKKLKMNTISGVPDWSAVFKGLVGSSNLQALKINGLVIGNKALSMLFTQVQFPFLGIFKLSGKSNFDEETMKIICFSQKLPKLNSLILKYDLISDPEIECITKTENLPLLKVLNLYGNYNLTVDCLKKIMQSDNLPFLEVIIYDQGEMLNRY